MWMRKTKHPACLVERRSAAETDDLKGVWKVREGGKERCGGGRWVKGALRDRGMGHGELCCG